MSTINLTDEQRTKNHQFLQSCPEMYVGQETEWRLFPLNQGNLKHPWHILWIFGLFSSLGIIAAEIQHSYYRCGHHFGITHVTLFIFFVSYGL